MSVIRLKSALRVQAWVKQATIAGIAATIVRRGDPDAGAIILKLFQNRDAVTLFTESRGETGKLIWLRPLGPVPVPEPDADAYLDRAIQRDTDLWIVEIDHQKGWVPFDETIL